MKLTEEMVRQINDAEKLQYLLIGMIQKKAEQSKKSDIQKKQLKDLRMKLKSTTEELSILHKKLDQIGLHQYDGTFEKIRADFNEFYFSQLFQLVQGIPTLNSDKYSNSPSPQSQLLSSIEEQFTSFNERISKTSEAQIDHFKNLVSDKNNEIESIKSKMNVLQEQLNSAVNSPISKDIEKLINDKDSAIIELKSMLQSSVNSDKRKQQQIEEQQAEIQKLHNLLSQSIEKVQIDSNLNSNLHSHDVGDVARLERIIADLEDRLSNSKATRELELKNERLSSMIEKSNLLYADAVEEIRKLKEKYESRKDSKQLKIIPNFFYQINNQNDDLSKNGNTVESFSLPATPKSRTALPTPLEKAQLKRIKHTYRALIASLRQTLLQFFLKDEASQISLVPVILELVGCTKPQVDAVMLKIQSNQNFVNRKNGFLGLFG